MFDWDWIGGVDTRALIEDEETAEQLFPMLCQGDFRNEENAQRLTKLFEVTKAVMQVKHMQYETCLEEMEQITKEAASEKEREYISEIEYLRSQLSQFQKTSGGGETYLRNEVNKLQHNNKLLEQEVTDINNRLLREQTSYDRLNTEMQQMEVKYQENKRELDRAFTDIKDYQRQYQTQRDNMTSRRTDVEEIREEMSKKNKELSQYLDDIRQLQEENDKLTNEVEHAKNELEHATNDMNNIADDYTKLKTVLQDTDQIVEDMRRERDVLRAQVDDMTSQLERQTEGDDQIMNELNDNVLRWKEILSGKDQEIIGQQKEIEELRRQLQVSQMDSDKKSVINLTEALAKKDEKIKELKKEIELATKDFDECTEHISTLKKQSNNRESSIFQQKTIQKLSSTVEQEKMNTLMERQRIIEVEQDVVEKDQQIAELTARLLQYEQGQYGLAQAVQEIKDCKVQLRERDKTIEEITSKMNAIYEEINDFSLENEEMRERLGIESRDQLDLSVLRNKKMVKEEQATALNRVLQKEVEKLEEERVELKRKLREKALEWGKRAVELGVSSADLQPEEYLVSRSSKPFKESKVHFDEPDKVNKSSPIKDSESDKIQLENKELKVEVSKLELGLREIHGAIKSNADPSVPIQIPSLDKLISIIEQKYATGQYDTTLELKATINNLTGRNEELRSELHKAQNEITTTITELDKRAERIDNLEKENASLQEISKGVIKLNPLPLPEGMNPTSKDIIACLNEYLVQILQELSNKEDLCADLEKCLEESRRNYSVLSHQQSIIYKEHLAQKKSFEEEKIQLMKSKEELLASKEEDKARLTEFDSLLERLDSDPSEHQRMLVEMTRKMTVLRVNEKSLSRRYSLLLEVEKNLRKELEKCKRENIGVEAAVAKKIGELERYKAMCTYKITALQKSLDDSVPSSELELANRQMNELTSKYRDLLQRGNSLAERSSALETLQAEMRALQHTNNTLKENLMFEKEKAHVLQHTLDELLQKMGKESAGENYQPEEICSLARKLATLEIMELNEREKAEHATQKYEQLKTLLNDLENRNADLGKRFAEISKLNLEAQRVERELNNELASCVPGDINAADKQTIIKLEEKVARFTDECDRLKQVAEVAQHQTESVMLHQTSQEKELVSLRKQMYHQQMEIDEKVIIAKLHQQVISLQVSEATAVRKLEVVTAQLNKKNLAILRLQKEAGEHAETMFHVRAETRSKTHFLKRMVHDLRKQFSGALPLARQEQFSSALQQLHDSKVELEQQLAQAQERNFAAESLSMELKVKLSGLRELIATLKDGQGAKKVVEWHEKMSQVKLDDLKLKNTIMQLNEKISYLERLKQKHEESISVLEETCIKQAKDYEDRQLLWEQHEVELERKIAKLEQQQKDIAVAAQKFEEATGSIPDENLPVASQLDMAIAKIKEHISTILMTRDQVKKMAEKLHVAEQNLRKSEDNLVRKDKMINELRLRLPLNDREVILEPSDFSTEENKDAKHAFRIAQATVESLKLMLQKKEENIVKYQNMLAQAREELRSANDTHRQEMRVLQERLQLEIDEHIKKIKKVHQDYINIPQKPQVSTTQLERLGELEEMVRHQDNALGTVASKYQHSQDQVEQVKLQAHHTHTRIQAQLKKQKDEYQEELSGLKKEIETEKALIKEKDMEIEVLSAELENAKQDNLKAPSNTMKSLVARLRDQLAKKDREQKALSEALCQIRADMVNTAGENVQAYARKMEEEVNIRQLIEKETSQLNSRIADLQERLKKIKSELKQKKEDEMLKTDQIDSMKRELQKKDGDIRELARELKERETFKGKFEKLKVEKEKLEQKISKNVPTIEEPVSRVTPQPTNQIDLTDLDEKPVKETKEQVIRWEESKKWQKKIEMFKNKCKERSDEAARLEKSSILLKEALSRQEIEKLALQSKIKSLSRGENSATPDLLQQEEIVNSLKNKIFELEDENNNLYRQVNLDNQTQLQMLRIENEQLKSSLAELELSNDIGDGEKGWGIQRENKFNKQLLELKKENIELRFENEQIAPDIPRLKTRVMDLTEYNEILKSEIETLKGKKRKVEVSGGQSVEEMERVVAAMRRVVERLQAENASLKKKKKPQPQHQQLVNENRTLKQDLQRLKQQQASENKRSTPSTSTSKIIVKENEKMLLDLKKEQETNQKLRIANQNLESSNKNLKTTIEEKNRLFAEVEKKVNDFENKEWKTSKQMGLLKYDDRVISLRDELVKKTSMLKDIKSHLKSSAEREADLLRKVELFQTKLRIVEELPSKISNKEEAIRHLQKYRLEMDRLEREKKQLRDELERLRQLSNNGATPVDVTQDEVLKKLENYDRLLSIEVELRAKIKGMEIEIERYKLDNKKLKKELGAFDPAFFEELEDLKYNYKVSLERNVMYETQLQSIADEYGVEVKIEKYD